MLDSLWSNFFRPQDDAEEGVRTILKKIPIFEGLKPRELGEVERILYRRDYKAGEAIFHQGDPAAGMYIVSRGKVQVIREESQQVIAELFDGDFFGELALLDESPRSATVIAKIDCQMLAFFKSELLDLIARKPKLGVRIAMGVGAVIGERLQRSNDQVHALQKELFELRQKRTTKSKDA